MPLDSPTFGRIYRPIAMVEVKANYDEWKIFYPEIDSGAPISVFNKSDCELLGLNLKEGKLFSLSGVLGGATSAYIHEIELKVGNEIINCKIAFTDGKNHKQLLGRIDFFDNFCINMKGKNKISEIIKE